MNMFRRVGMVGEMLAGLSVAAAAPAPGPAPVIADLRPIELHDGSNTVPGLLPDGGTATVVDAWRDNGNVHGYSVLLVLSPNAEAQAGGVVGIDNPHTGLLDDYIVNRPSTASRPSCCCRRGWARHRQDRPSIMRRRRCASIGCRIRAAFPAGRRSIST